MSPTDYRLVVKGKLGARYAFAFEGMTVSAHGGITELTGGILWIIGGFIAPTARAVDDGVTSILSGAPRHLGCGRCDRPTVNSVARPCATVVDPSLA